MRYLHRLTEDIRVAKIPIIFSKDIKNRIESIYSYNQSNWQAILKWKEYLEGIKNYVSNRSIAWDYANSHYKFPNGTNFIRDYNFNVGYSVKINDYPHKSPFDYQDPTINK